ncbi:MAG: hypothetical protein M0C28_49305, partial [Candidatus Moduliflexus flocculans]|nr:hypothetical protein [Candidatus Moduliflexus flocculans]
CFVQLRIAKVNLVTGTQDSAPILTSGDLNFIAATCDKILVFDDSRIAESGTHRIITGEFIKKYFNIEAVVTKNIYSGLPEVTGYRRKLNLGIKLYLCFTLLRAFGKNQLA